MINYKIRKEKNMINKRNNIGEKNVVIDNLGKIDNPNSFDYLNDSVSKNDIVTIIYDEENLQPKFGELLFYHLSAIDKEPPEIKILFALIHHCKIQINSSLVPLEPCRFENPALSEEILSILSEKLGVKPEPIFTILDSAPEGVVSVIVSIVK